jgi:hypothetical protein
MKGAAVRLMGAMGSEIVSDALDFRSAKLCFDTTGEAHF